MSYIILDTKPSSNHFPCRFLRMHGNDITHDSVTAFLRQMATEPIRESWLSLYYQGEKLDYSFQLSRLPPNSAIEVFYADQTWVPLPIPPPAARYPSANLYLPQR